MSTRPPGRPTGGSWVLLLAVFFIIVAVLAVWARSAHPPGTSHPAATGVPPTLPAKAQPATH